MLGDDAGLTAAVLAAQDGDEDAFRTVYRAVQPRLLGYIRTLVGDPDAEDVASEAWLQIARDLDRFSGDADRFRGWAARIARNRALDHLRMRGRRPAIGGDETELSGKPAGSDTADEAIEALATGRTMSLIAQLPQDQAEAVVLRVVVGLDAKSAAQTLGKRPGAVRTAAHRGLKRLAELLRADDADRAGSAGNPGGEGGLPAAGPAEGSRPRGDGTAGGVGAPRGPGGGTNPAQSPQNNGAGRTVELGAVPAQRPSRTGLVAPAGVTHSRLWTQKDM
ncbi:RNA polymerase sigma factor [Streptomyces poriferorum]|uniref:RNA polymerase sigma factor n=1 Tax=Streptomyces poriferorum TaxID=2798799 RepID=A0ABY9IPS3_9ACTN|nr:MULTISPECIES: RNA polymerase sigma factor [Streptomyces]MBW5259198.1 RNA polymerase sigma factor [Streptomyces poriferorum]MDP5314235.1 RNA polymerase sigma factor [Streptomyces sp. Alt4]WLQ50497.1 RNA polymerase sigma factor [Streptomyces sp. Alt1]WLQ56839.1 RNA polymerase sigma factor [Streptomyces sp. Alt2]